jgi:hypothetical protein
LQLNLVWSSYQQHLASDWHRWKAHMVFTWDRFSQMQLESLVATF